jgi:hypothetical protein
MNKIFFLTVALSLLVSVSTTVNIYPPWAFTDAQIKEIKKMIKGTGKQVNGKCEKGFHKMSTWSQDQWGFSSGCVRNDANCGNFDYIKGNCKLCKWSTNMTKDPVYGDWCHVTWYAWLYFYLALFLGIALLVMTAIACKTYFAQKKAYKKLEDSHVEMVSQDSYSEEDSHVRYNNPYHH